MNMLFSVLQKPGKALRLAAQVARHGVPSYLLAREAIFERHGLQITWELMGLIGVVRRLRPQVVMEIGTRKGGTLFCWARSAMPDALLLSVDLPGGRYGGGQSENEANRFRGFLQSDQQLVCVRDDSHRPETLDQVKSVLGERSVDFLFIDGDHTFMGVAQDFEMYAPLVRPGGKVAFHDIAPHTDQSCGVDEFWRSVKDRYEHEEFVYDWKQGWSGIGVLKIPRT